MSRARLAAGLLALSAAMGWWAAPTADAQGQPVVVEGQVLNGTLGGGGLQGLTVVLKQEGGPELGQLIVVTDSDGRFRFQGIEPAPDALYDLSVEYQGARYGASLDLSAAPPAPVSLTVYETSSSEDLVSVSSAAVIFTQADGASGVVSALEIVTLVNDSDRAYVPGPQPMDLIRFGLPPGSRELRVESRLEVADFVQVDRGFALIANVPPGEHELMFAYVFPYSGAEHQFTKSLRYGARQLRIMAPDDVVRLSSEQLEGPESIMIGDRPYQLLQTLDLPRGAQVSAVLEGLPQPSFAERLEERVEGVRFEYAGPVALGLFMAVVIIYALWKRSPERLEQADGVSDMPAAEHERRALVGMISDLERSFEAGTLAQDEYRSRRAALASRLTTLSES